MKIINRSDVECIALLGRSIQKAIGLDAFSYSDKMSIGYACYKKKYGKMDPHCHAEETVYILKVRKGFIRIGKNKQDLNIKIQLHPGMLLHLLKDEWHVFEYDKGGSIEIIFIYGQVDSIRPEDKDTIKNLKF